METERKIWKMGFGNEYGENTISMYKRKNHKSDTEQQWKPKNKFEWSMK